MHTKRIYINTRTDAEVVLPFWINPAHVIWAKPSNRVGRCDVRLAGNHGGLYQLDESFDSITAKLAHATGGTS